MLHDLQSALRALRRDPRFTLPAGVILALGVAAAVTVFSVTNAYLLRPLPYPDPDRIVWIEESGRSIGWRDEQAIFSDVAAWDLDAFNIISDGAPEEVLGSWVTPGFFDVLGVRPARGRVFTAEEARSEAAAMVVISHKLWQSRFGGDPDIVGRTFRAFTADRPDEAESFTIIGVLPADFWFPGGFTDVLAPLRGERRVSMARLAPSVSAADAARVLSRLYTERSGVTGANAVVNVTTIHDWHVTQVRPRLALLLGAVGLLLAIAAVNATVLQVVRATVRERELTIRHALGAGRWRIARQLIAEGSVLAFLAAGAGVFLAWLIVEPLAGITEARLGTSIPGGPKSVTLDRQVLLAALLVAVAAAGIFALVPLLTTGGRRLARVLAAHGRGLSDTRERQRVRSALIAAELALALALLVGAALLGKSALHQQRLDPGFDLERLLTATIQLRRSSYPEPADRTQFFDRLVERLEAEPAIEAATTTLPIPLGPMRQNRSTLEPEGVEDARVEATVYTVRPDFFADLRVPLASGRALQASDGVGALQVAVVSDGFAARVWPGQNAIGKRFRAAASGPGTRAGAWRTVVGVSGHVRADLRSDDLPDVFVPTAQQSYARTGVMIRTRGEPAAAIATLRSVLHELDPELAAATIATMDELTADTLREGRFFALFLGAFATFSLILACCGLYAVVFYAVQQRRREIAIRMSLGANAQEVVALFLRNSMVVVAAATVSGIALTLPLSRFVRDRLDGVSAHDPGTYAAAIFLLSATAAVAVWLPARRAASTEPADVLRSE